ncbi:hypothetical protein [Lelliottia wanjuensis]|uniref:hypothetical protein n=1 Tax=Lelliottia wanjuensis TaxID=3050585 RepID=UPI00254F6D11|nr:hypothetical protein [Lelliottia sp. V86_10]MDK9585872.1 hypothetical protein [Lelliottia sp. V86_10]
MTNVGFQKGHKLSPGRAKGSRNKSALSKAQLLADAAAVPVVKMWVAMVTGDNDFLASIGIDGATLKPKERLEASKALQALSSTGFKELEKAAPKTAPVEPVQRPVFQTVARLPQKAAS